MKKKTFVLVIFFMLTLTACNLPAPESEGPRMEDLAGTLAAQTLTAVAEQMPTETKIPLATPTKAQPTITPAPSLTPTSTQQLVAPRKPTLNNYNFTCQWNGTNLDLSITLQWTDNDSNEDGYYVYRNSQKIADLAPNSANHVDLYAVNSGTPVTYTIEAYNNLGRSNQIVVTVQCE